MKHTPGQWKIVGLHRGFVDGHEANLYSVEVDAVAGGGCALVRTEDDAHLVSAAPELLAALEKLIDEKNGGIDDYWKTLPEGKAIISEVCAALAKAKGDLV